MRYSFDQFELDTARFSWVRGGRNESLEPKVFEFLRYMLENRNRLVSKEELNEKLWGGRAITDAALTRCLYQARKALGDSSADQKYLITVHGRGIRFNGDVEVRMIDDPPETLDPPQPLRVGMLRGLLSGSRKWIALLVLGVMAAVLGMLWTRSSAPPTSEPREPVHPESPFSPPSLAILPIVVKESPEDTEEVAKDLELLALSLTDLMSSRLSEVPVLRLRPRPELPPKEEIDRRMHEIAQESGASHLLKGSLVATSQGRGLLELEVLENQPGRLLRIIPLGRIAIPFIRGQEDLVTVLRLRDAMAQRLLDVLGTTFAFEGPEIGGTQDAEAWRLYILAYQRLSDGFCEGSLPAIALLERALARDPEFALAWSALGTAYYNRVWACGESADLYDKVFSAFDRAVTAAPELRQPRLTRLTLWIETGRVEKAYATLLEELQQRPDDPTLLVAQAYALRYAGFLVPSAAALDKALELDPLIFVVGTVGGSPNTYLYQGRFERFLEVVPASGMPYHLWYRGFTHWMMERPDLARSSLGSAFRKSPSQIFGRLAEALLAVLDQDPDTAISIVNQVANQRRELGALDAEITLKQAQVLALAGAEKEALNHLAETVEQGFFCVPCFDLDPSFKAYQGQLRWEKIRHQALQRHLAFAGRFGITPEAQSNG